MILRGQHRIFSECSLTFMKHTNRVCHTGQNTAFPLISVVKLSLEVRYLPSLSTYEVQDFLPNNLVSPKQFLNTLIP